MAYCPQAREPAGDDEAKSDGPKVVDIFRRHGDQYRALYPLSPEQDRLLRDMQVCRTAALGGHLYVCPECGFEQPQYNSCRNRGCPNCQALAQGEWIEKRNERILPVGHHHVVFTLPAQLRPLALRNQREAYSLLFSAAWETMQLLAKEDLDAQLGVTAVLHTWTRELGYHPHVHCVVTAGALSTDGTTWVERTSYFFPGARLKAVFRSRMLAGLRKLCEQGKVSIPEDGEDTSDSSAWERLERRLPGKKKWVVYTEPPLGRSTQVLSYLGRYTHRIAISDYRLVSIDDNKVCFRTHGDDTITLEALEFMRRFFLHVLPQGFRKIRHFGLYAPVNVNGRLEQARALLGGDEGCNDEVEDESPPETWVELLARLIEDDPLRCPKCKIGRMQVKQALSPTQRGPPKENR